MRRSPQRTAISNERSMPARSIFSMYSSGVSPLRGAAAMRTWSRTVSSVGTRFSAITRGG